MFSYQNYCISQTGQQEQQKKYANIVNHDLKTDTILV